MALYSARLIDVLRNLGVRHEAYPVVMRHRKTGEAVLKDRGYQVVRLLEEYPVVNDELSHLGPTYRVEKLVLKDHAQLEETPVLFKDTNFSFLTFAQTKLKQVCEDEAISGCSFTTVDSFLSQQLPF